MRQLLVWEIEDLHTHVAPLLRVASGVGRYFLPA